MSLYAVENNDVPRVYNVEEVVFRDDVLLDLSYQRQPTDVALAKFKQWNHNIKAHLVMSRRADGSLYCIDGGHRTEGSRRYDGPTTFSATVYYGLTPEEEADMFNAYNNFKPVTALQKFKSRAFSQRDEVASEIQAVLDETGVRVGYKGLMAIGKLEEIHCGMGLRIKGATYPEVTEAVLAVCINSWGYESDGFARDVIGGLGYLIHKYPDYINFTRLVQVLSEHTPKSVKVNGNGRAKSAVVKNDIGTAMYIHALYNKGLRSASSKLPSFPIF